MDNLDGLLFIVVVLATLFIVYTSGRMSQESAKAILDAAKHVTEVAEQLSDDGDPDRTTLFERLAQYAKTGVEAAEQLYLTGQLPAEERYKYAEDFVRKMLKLTVDRDSVPAGMFDWYELFEGFIEAAVKRLPKRLVLNEEGANEAVEGVAEGTIQPNAHIR